MFEVIAYYPGPQTVWTQQLADEDIVARHLLPLRFLAQMRLRTLRECLNTARCGFLVRRGAEVLLHLEPPPTEDALDASVS